MGVQIKFESSNSVEGVGSTPGTSRIPLEDFYDVIAEYKKNPKKLEGILTKNANLSSEAKDFMRKFIQYSNKNKIFDGFSKDNPETSEDEFKNELINFVQEQKKEKDGANTLNFNDTFSTKASKVSPKRKDNVISFDKADGFSTALEFFDEDADLRTQEKVIKDNFLFEENGFKESAENTYKEKIASLDTKSTAYKEIEPFIFKLKQGLKLSGKEVKALATSLNIKEEDAQDLIENIKIKYYEARSKSYLDNIADPGTKIEDLDTLTKFFLMEPSGSYDDFNYRHLGTKDYSPTEFIEAKQNLALDSDFQEIAHDGVDDQLFTSLDEAKFEVLDIASEYDPENEDHIKARLEISRLADYITTNPDSSSTQVNTAFDNNILLKGYSIEDKAGAILALNGILSAKPAAASIMKAESLKNTAQSIESEMGIRDLKHLSSTKDWLIWLKSSENMDALPAELKSNSHELLEKITNFEDLDYGDLMKFSKLFHVLGMDKPQDRMEKAKNAIKEIYAERKALIEGDIDLKLGGLSPSLADNYKENFEIAKLFNNIGASDKAKLLASIKNENLLEANQIISQKSDFEALQNPLIQGLIAKLKPQESLFGNLRQGSKEQKQNAWLNIIQSLANLESNETYNLKGKDIDNLTSIQALKKRSKAHNLGNIVSPNIHSGAEEVQITKEKLKSLISSLEGQSDVDKLKSLRTLLADNGASKQAYALIPLLLDSKGKSLIQEYLKSNEDESLSQTARSIRDDIYFDQGLTKGIKGLTYAEDGKELETQAFDLDTRETSPPDPVSGEGGGQTLFNNMSHGMVQAYNQDTGEFSQELFDELPPGFFQVFQVIDPSVTQEDFLTAFKGQRINESAPFAVSSNYQFIIDKFLKDLETKYDNAVTGNYSTEDLTELVQRRRAVQSFMDSEKVNVNIYREGKRKLPISSQEIENGLRELVSIASKTSS